MPAGAKPLCPIYDRVAITPSQVIIDRGLKDDLGWLIGQSLVRKKQRDTKNTYMGCI